MNAPTRLPEAEISQIELVDLVRRAQEGDREAFRELCEQYTGHVVNVAHARLDNYHEVQDVVQAVFLRALENIDQLRNPQMFGSWLCSMASNSAIDKIRRSGRSTHVSDEGMEMIEVMDDRTPVAQLGKREDAAFVHDAIGLLGDRVRRAVELFYFQEKSLKEMVLIFSAEEGRDIPLNTVKRRLHLARRKLGEILGPVFGRE